MKTYSLLNPQVYRESTCAELKGTWITTTSISLTTTSRPTTTGDESLTTTATTCATSRIRKTPLQTPSTAISSRLYKDWSSSGSGGSDNTLHSHTLSVLFNQRDCIVIHITLLIDQVHWAFSVIPSSNTKHRSRVITHHQGGPNLYKHLVSTALSQP